MVWIVHSILFFFSVTSIAHNGEVTYKLKYYSPSGKDSVTYNNLQTANDSLSYLSLRDDHFESQDSIDILISLDLKNVLLIDVLNALEEQFAIRLFYSTDLICQENRIDVFADKIPLLIFLDDLLGDTDIDFIYSQDGHVILFSRQKRVDGLINNQTIGQKTATIVGTVSDMVTGEPLVGANITIMGSKTGTSTDVDGRFTLRRIPSGNYNMVIKYLGYQTKNVNFYISADNRVEKHISLENDLIVGDEVLITGYQRGQARALTRQRESANIMSVISSEQIDRFGDFTVESALKRIAGVQHSGGINIRGVGRTMYNVMYDGQRMGTTGTGDRSIDLETISTDMVYELDVIKVITPDMDADAMSGVINIRNRRPVGYDRDFDIRLGGGYNPRVLSEMGYGSRFSLSYVDTPHSDFSYVLHFSYQRDVGSIESVQTDWDIKNLGVGPSYVLTNVRPRINFDPRIRYGTGLHLTFQPTDRSTYHLQGMFNIQLRDQVHHESRLAIGDDWIDRYTTGRRGEMGQIWYESRLQEHDTKQYIFQAGARHLYDWFDLDYKLGWGYARNNIDLYGFTFRTSSEFDFAVNMDNRSYPIIDIINEPGYPEAQRFFFDFMDNQWDEHVNNELTGNVDIEIPHNRGYLKFGTSTHLTFKSGNHEDHRMTYQQKIRVTDFDRVINADWMVFGHHHSTYHIPWLVDPLKGKDFFYSNFPHFNLNLERWAENSETVRYYAQEYTYAGYGMSTFRIGPFKFLGGVRVEHTQTRYDGREPVINKFGRYQGSKDIREENSYTHLFPNAQLVYAIGQRTNIRFAYSKSIGRPDFIALAPYRLLDYNREVIHQGNPKLDLVISNNLDFLFEHYFLNVGVFSIGLYHKNLSNFVFQSNRIIDEGEFSGWTLRAYNNGKEATIYGMEVSWQQSLGFLPGFLGNIGVFSNYSYSQSMADVGRDDYYPLPDQRPHIINMGLEYRQGGFSGQVSYHRSSPAIHSYYPRQWVPEIHLRERVYFDRYHSDEKDVSVSLRYRLPSGFRIWIDGSNLLNHNRIDYHYNREYYPYLSEFIGRTFSLGVGFSL